MRAISHTERDGESGHARVFLLLDMSSLDLFPSTLVVLARSFERAFFYLKSSPVKNIFIQRTRQHSISVKTGTARPR